MIERFCLVSLTISNRKTSYRSLKANSGLDKLSVDNHSSFTKDLNQRKNVFLLVCCSFFVVVVVGEGGTRVSEFYYKESKCNNFFFFFLGGGGGGVGGRGEGSRVSDFFKQNANLKQKTFWGVGDVGVSK